MREEIIKKQIEKAQADIIEKEILIGFLESQKKDMTKEEKAKTDLKIEGMNQAIRFNKDYVDYVSKI